MNCTKFEDRLDDYLDGKLSEVEQRAALAHEAECEACAVLAASLRETLAALGPDLGLGATAAPDLAATIVARTSGPACGRVQACLPGLVDGALPEADADLVRAHLAHCARCTALQQTLGWLVTALPQLCFVEPPVDLTEEIVAATSGIAMQRAARRRALRKWFQQLLARPRFAYEFAYVATVLLVLLLASPLSPFKDVPSRALAMIQVDPRPAAAQLRGLHGEIGTAGSRVWDGTAGRVAEASREAGDDVAERHPGMRRAWKNLQQHSGEARRNLAGGNFASAGLSMNAVAADLRALWRAWRAPAPNSTSAPN